MLLFEERCLDNSHSFRNDQLWTAGRKMRGYARTDFFDAWSRYCGPPRLPASQDGRSVEARSPATFDDGPDEVQSGTEQESTVLPFDIPVVSQSVVRAAPESSLAPYDNAPPLTDEDLESFDLSQDAEFQSFAEGLG